MKVRLVRQWKFDVADLDAKGANAQILFGGYRGIFGESPEWITIVEYNHAKWGRIRVELTRSELIAWREKR